MGVVQRPTFLCTLAPVMSPSQHSRFIAYVRVSSTEQATEGYSLEAQTKRLEAWALAHGVTLVETIADEGISAGSLKRPGLTRALELLEANEADGLVIVKLDRLTRKTRDLLRLVEEVFSEGGAALASVEESIDTDSAGGRMVLTMLGAMATWEREVIGERTRAVLQHLKAEGVRLGGIPLGLENTGEKDENGRAVLRVSHSEDATLREILKRRKAGESLRAIANDLNERSIPTKRGGTWHASTIRYILQRAA
jgi:site-specific DNA recombinase